MRFHLIILLAILFTSPLTAQAQLKENSETWTQIRVGSKICFADHEHYGESPPWVSKSGAKAYAIRKWEGFTTWEYGRRWGSYRLAISKRLTCKKQSGRWFCSTTARPCRRR